MLEILDRKKSRTRKVKRVAVTTSSKKVSVKSGKSHAFKGVEAELKGFVERVAAKRIDVMVKGLTNMYSSDAQESLSAVNGLKKYTIDELNQKYAGVVVVAK